MHVDPFSLLLGILLLGATERIWKPFSMLVVDKLTLGVVIPQGAEWLQWADPFMPEFIREKNSEELEEWLIDGLVALTDDESWKTKSQKRKSALRWFERTHSPMVNADVATDDYRIDRTG